MSTTSNSNYDSSTDHIPNYKTWYCEECDLRFVQPKAEHDKAYHSDETRAYGQNDD